jgi:hypothetical protein
MGLRTAPVPGEALPGRFTTDTGWRVELSSARMLLGPFYLFEKASPLAGSARRPAGLGARLGRGVAELLLPSAHADEGFFAGGRVLGEWDREVVFDLLAGGEVVLGRVPGIAGTARSLSVLLQPATVVKGPEGAQLGGHSLVLAGTASRAGHEVPFRAGLNFPPPLELQRVESIPIEAPIDEDGTFLVEVRPHSWFQGTHFDRLEVPATGEPVTLTPESQVYRAVHVNVRRHTAFSGQWLG